jgi:hypothetical protein
MMKKFIQEPLLHFAILGAMIFTGYSLVGERDTMQPDSIVVTTGKIGNLAALFERTWQRPPTRQELDGLIQDHVREEVFYREGVALGLDRDDTVIRRRIRQKMDFIIEDMSAQADPGDEVLQDYLQQHAEQFHIAPQFSFRQIYLNPQQRGDAIVDDAENLLAELNQEAGTIDPATLGDRLMLEPAYRELPLHQVSRLFGEEFAEALSSLSAGEWRGPVRSGYGLHLVRIDERLEGRLPELAEVRDSVLREWDNSRRSEAREQFYQSLLERYSVVIEAPQSSADDDAGVRTAGADQ